MKHTKKLGNFSLSDSIESTTQASSFNSISKFIPKTSKKPQTNPIKPFISIDVIDLEDIAQIFSASSNPNLLDIPFDEAIDTFITKHITPSFSTLDELLNASLQNTTYNPKRVKALSDVLDGLIEDF